MYTVHSDSDTSLVGDSCSQRPASSSAVVLTDHVLAALDRGVAAASALQIGFSDLHHKLEAADVPGQVSLLFKPTRDKLGQSNPPP